MARGRWAAWAAIVGGAVLLGGGPSLAAESLGYVLAASWEPAFCMTKAGESKRECRSETAGGYDATHLSLHGLWPDDLTDKAIYPCYCGDGAAVDCHANLPDQKIRLSQPVFDALKPVMPGVQSGLHRHEWSKHGSCSKTSAGETPDPDDFFTFAANLIHALNASPVGALFAAKVGDELTREEIEAAFDNAFGAGASSRLVIACSGHGDDATIAELRINISGAIGSTAKLADLIQAAPPASSSTDDQSCARGRVAAVE